MSAGEGSLAGRGLHRLALGLAAIALSTACSVDRPAAGESSPPAGAVLAPDFTLPDLDGAPVRLADFRGKTVVIDFWATWCPPCVFQVPELNAFWDAHREAGDLAVLGVAVDAEGAEVVAPWAEAEDIRYTVLIGDEGLAREFGILGFPTLVIVAPDGTIDSQHTGLVEVGELEAMVAPLGG